jgi:hypothetical protein
VQLGYTHFGADLSPLLRVLGKTMTQDSPPAS